MEIPKNSYFWRVDNVHQFVSEFHISLLLDWLTDWMADCSSLGGQINLPSISIINSVMAPVCFIHSTWENWLEEDYPRPLAHFVLNGKLRVAARGQYREIFAYWTPKQRLWSRSMVVEEPPTRPAAAAAEQLISFIKFVNWYCRCSSWFSVRSKNNPQSWTTWREKESM